MDLCNNWQRSTGRLGPLVLAYFHGFGLCTSVTSQSRCCCTETIEPRHKYEYFSHWLGRIYFPLLIDFIIISVRDGRTTIPWQFSGKFGDKPTKMHSPNATPDNKQRAQSNTNRARLTPSIAWNHKMLLATLAATCSCISGNPATFFVINRTKELN